MTGAEVRAAREALGLTKSALGRLLGSTSGLPAAAVSRWEDRGLIGDSAAVRGRLLAAYLAGYRPPDWPSGLA